MSVNNGGVGVSQLVIVAKKKKRKKKRKHKFRSLTLQNPAWYWMEYLKTFKTKRNKTEIKQTQTHGHGVCIHAIQ